LAPRTDCENTHQVVLQKLQEGKQAFVNQNAALLTVEMETQLREALLEREARVNQLENQRIVLESTRAELITELDAHKSKAGSLAQDISRQQAQQMSLVKDSVVLAERQNAKLEQLLQQVPASEEIKEYLSDCEELLSDIKSKTQELKRMSERDSPDFERCNGLMIDLGRYYQRCYVDIIRLMRQAGVAHAESDVKIEQAKAGQEIQEWKKRYDNSHVELAGAKQAYEETRRLLAEKEAHLSSLALRENTLSTELDKKQAVLEEALQRQEALEKEKAQVSELTRAQKAGWEEEQNKLRQQLQTIEKKSAEQSLKIEQLKEMEAEKAAAVKKAGEESEKSALKKVTIVQAEANVQVALQAEEMQKLKEELAAEKKKWAEEKEKAEKAKEVAEKLALEKAQIEAVRQSAEKIHVEQREKVKTEAQAEKVQVALQAEDMQKLKEKFAAMEAEAASAKAKAEQLAAEKAKVEADQKYTEKIQAEQTQKALDQKERQKAQVALQAEEILKLKEKLAAMETEAASAKAKAEQLMAEKAQIEADQKYVEKIQPEQAKRVLEEEERRKAEAEQAQKEQEKAEQRNKAVEEEKKEEGTEGRIKVYSHFFKPPKATPPDVAAFLRLVAEGEQDKAEALLKENPGLGVAAGSVTDLSKRTFKNITALQYALWALDWNMWMMLLKYIPRDEAQLQAMALEENGTEHGKHFDFSQLLGAYESYKQGYNGWDWNQRETHWCQQIGGAQLLLPAHVVNEYCRPDRAFYPLPDFTQIGLPRGREMNGKTGTDFFTHEYNGGRAGDKWAMYRGRVEAGGVTYHWIGAELAMDDAEAAAMIKEVRMSQRQSMIKELLSNKLIVAKKR
ncbi:MAG: hypothetical protein K0S27_615, partial [Gammaproteobacteria bacterium]|nr:hypothetical protein [Gammaproteobacteria bacterium]